MILYDFLDIILFLSIKVNYSPPLVYLHQIMDNLFSHLPPKSYFCLPLTILVAYATSFCVIFFFKEHFCWQQTQIFSMYCFTTLTKEFADLPNLKRHSFLSHMKVAELKSIVFIVIFIVWVKGKK